MGEFLNNLNNFIWGLPFIIFVMIVGLYFSARGGFFTIAHFGHVMKQTLGSLMSKESNTKEKGQVSPFEAVCVAIGGCVGCANIAGVATAMMTGGYGAIFWMWLWAFFGMMVKLVEVTLGCYYRSKNERGEYYGGPMLKPALFRIFAVFPSWLVVFNCWISSKVSSLISTSFPVSRFKLVS